MLTWQWPYMCIGIENLLFLVTFDYADMAKKYFDIINELG
jgi:thiamine kinase-like enzyme